MSVCISAAYFGYLDTKNYQFINFSIFYLSVPAERKRKEGSEDESTDKRTKGRKEGQQGRERGWDVCGGRGFCVMSVCLCVCVCMCVCVLVCPDVCVFVCVCVC